MSQNSLLTTKNVVVLVLALGALLSGLYFARRSGTNPDGYGNDFSVYYHAAREIIAGRDLYQHSLADWTPYLYLPLLAVLLTPLALLPLPIAAYLWFLMNAVATLAAAWMSASVACNYARDRGKSSDETINLQKLSLVPLVAAASLLVVARFVLDNFNLGQVNPVIAALVAAHVYLDSKNRRNAAALALAVAASIKLTPLVLIGCHLARRRWKFAVTCIGLFIAVTAASFLPLGAQAPDAFRVFVNRTIKNEQGYDLAYPGNQSLRGAIARLAPSTNGDAGRGAGESTRQPVTLVTLLISLALLGVSIIAARQAPSEVLAAAPFVCCFVLLSPLSWKAHFVVLVVPVACLVAEAARSSRTRRRVLIAILALVFILFNSTSPLVTGLAAAEWADAHSLVFAGALTLLWFSFFLSTQQGSRRNDIS